MRHCSRTGATIALASLLFVPISRGQEANSAASSNDVMIHHMEELERQVRELQAEVATLKEKDKSQDAARSASPVLGQSNLVSGQAATPGSQQEPSTSLSSLLGPTTLSGFVDV